MAQLSIPLSGSLSVGELLRNAREMEDLFFRLVSISSQAVKNENVFGFDSLVEQPPPREEELLNLSVFGEADSDEKQTSIRAAFTGFGGAIAVDGVLLIEGKSSFVIFSRGPDPEWPKPHEASSPEEPEQKTVEAPADIPAHARNVFGGKRSGEFGGLPWEKATAEKMTLEGLAGSTVQTFRGESGNVTAFIMVTDADIDIDGANGDPADDPYFKNATSLRFPNGASCNSRAFPGVVRSVRLRDRFGLKLGDFALVCHEGRILECQVYDQGQDDKIGEISIFAARKLGGVPPTKTDRWAAVAGNFTKELVTLFFPGSSATNRAVSNVEIAESARACFAALTGRSSEDPKQLESVPDRDEKPDGKDFQRLTIQTREEWGARSPRVNNFPLAKARGIVVHNTQDVNREPLMGADELKKAFGLSRRIQKSHMDDRGWSDIGQHFTISRGGIIMEARHGTLAAARLGQVVRGAHAGSNLHNREWFGIELEGDFRKELLITQPQRAALIELCAWLCKMGNFLPENIAGHRQVKPGNGTDCPGKFLDRLAELRNDVMQRLAAVI